MKSDLPLCDCIEIGHSQYVLKWLITPIKDTIDDITSSFLLNVNAECPRCTYAVLAQHNNATPKWLKQPQKCKKVQPEKKNGMQPFRPTFSVSQSWKYFAAKT